MQAANLTLLAAFARLKVAACIAFLRAEVAELADAHGSGPCTRKGVGVRVPSSAPIIENKTFAAGLPTRCTIFRAFPEILLRIHYVSEVGDSKFPSEFVERVLHLAYRQFLFLPKSGPVSVVSVARLDEVRSMRKVSWSPSKVLCRLKSASAEIAGQLFLFWLV